MSPVRRFGEAALARGLIDEATYLTALDTLRAHISRPDVAHLGAVLVDGGYLTRDDVRRMLIGLGLSARPPLFVR